MNFVIIDFEFTLIVKTIIVLVSGAIAYQLKIKNYQTQRPDITIKKRNTIH